MINIGKRRECFFDNMIIVRESFRANEGPNKLVKYTSRLDGFVSLHAGGDEATVTTKEFIYDGGDLYAIRFN